MKIVLATGNQGKVLEFQSLLAPMNIEVIPQSEFNVGSVAETGLSFIENAIIKARHASKLSQLPAIADDSGLAVDALNGRPGIYSARFAGGDATDADNNNLLLEQLALAPNLPRTARFHCVLAYLRHWEDPTPLICHGVWEGEIAAKPDGDNGFGYDPLFYIPELKTTSAQLDKATKNSISHRGKAMQQLLQILSL